MQECKKCKEVKPFSNFYKQSRSGLPRGTCKKCANKSSRERGAEARSKTIKTKGGANVTPTKERLHELFSYNDGELTSKVSRGNIKQGSNIEGTDLGGYKRITVDGINYLKHRIIWKMIKGFDSEFLDHIDNNRSNNRIENLRVTSKKTNSRKQLTPSNNSTGLIGVSLVKASGKYRAMICVNHKDIVIGTFSSKIAAAKAYNKAAIKYHGDAGEFKAGQNEIAMASIEE